MNQGETLCRGETTQHADGIAEDLRSLRKLAVQLRRLAGSADDQVLRAILGKRESLLVGIRVELAAAAEKAESVKALANAEGRGFAQIVAEICAMDQESSQLLRKRADDVAADIQKVRAGRMWRQSCQP